MNYNQCKDMYKSVDEFAEKQSELMEGPFEITSLSFFATLINRTYNNHKTLFFCNFAKK